MPINFSAISNARELQAFIQLKLKVAVGENEAKSMAFLLIEYFWKISRTDVVLEKPVHISVAQQEAINDVLARLQAHEPLQYVLGETEFYGRKFKLNKHVLIPRPETEELVQLIISENKLPGLNILDIGTGSGCIPISLQKELRQNKVFALDIDENALQVARENAMLHVADVHFMQADILNDKIIIPPMDIIVSNPPYVLKKEKPFMQPNVLDHEPALALFVDDESPLVFYKAIVKHAAYLLKEGGKIYFEINEVYGDEVAALLAENNFVDVLVKKDMQGKDRFARGKKN